MARRAALSGFSLSLFGSGGVDAGVFSIASQSRQNQAYLALTRVEVQWEAGKVTDDDYLAALATYVGTFPADSAERLNQQSRLESTRYRIERNVLVHQVEAGSKEWSDLLTFDQSKLEGLNADSQEYRDRQNLLYNTQARVLAEEEKVVVERYGDGKMTTAQLSEWYSDRLADPRFTGNTELLTQITERVADLADRLTDERDSKVLSDYAAGKMSPADFLGYAAAARARYADGTPQAQEWDDRLEQARDSAVEDDLAYRYGLSQDYMRLKQFVQGNQAPKGGTSTSTSKRTVLGADGKWHVVTSTSSKAYAPSRSEQEAWKKRQVEVTEAKRQMAQIEKKLAGLAGGFVDTTEMIAYYKRQLVRVARGSSEWYAIQSKIDNLNDALSAEKVLSRQGVKLSFPKVKSEKREKYQPPKPTPPPGGGGGGGSSASAASDSGAKLSGGGDHDLQDFMNAIAKIESNGRYDARNKNSGAYGKYQIMPSNWSSWARRAGLPADAKQTPENQERVARAAFQRLYNKYDGDWSRMAAEWFAGAAGSKGGPSAWGPNTRRYVSNVMGAMGTSYSPGRATGSGPTYSRGGGGGTGTPAPTPKGGGKGKPSVPGVKAITGVDTEDETVKLLRRHGREVDPHDYATYTTLDIPFPRGMDARQFRKIYDAMESAWQNGEDTALIDVGGGQRMAVFLGDDPAERRKIMDELDDMRIDLADAELSAYRGTASESSKSQSAVAARKDANRHDLLSLNLVAAGGKGSGVTNPLAQATRVLDRIVAGVEKEVALGKAAYDRGDLTEAYLHMQRAQDLVQPDVTSDGRVLGDLGQLVNLVAQAESAISGVVGRSGQSLDQLLSGAGKAGTELKGDLERIQNADAEIREAFKDGLDVSKLLDNQLKKDDDGNVIWSQPGQRGQVVLADDFIRTITPSGTIKIERNTEREVHEDGSVGPATPAGKSKVLIKSGTSVLDAYADYRVAKVGFVTMPDGSKVPISGKVVAVPIDKNGDGVMDGVSTYFENPLKPGKWSSTPIMVKAPAGATVVFGSSGSTEPAIQYQRDGITYTLQLDNKTGVYQVWKQEPGGFAAPPADPVMLGTAGQSPEAGTIIEDFGRDLSHLSDYDRLIADIGAPALGMDGEDWFELKVKPEVTAAAMLGIDIGRIPLAGSGSTTKAQSTRGGQVRRYATPKGKATITVVDTGTGSRKRAGGLAPIPPRETPKPGLPQPTVAPAQPGLTPLPIPRPAAAKGVLPAATPTVKGVRKLPREPEKKDVRQAGKAGQTVVDTGGRSRKRAGGVRRLRKLPKPTAAVRSATQRVAQ